MERPVVWLIKFGIIRIRIILYRIIPYYTEFYHIISIFIILARARPRSAACALEHLCPKHLRPPCLLEQRHIGVARLSRCDSLLACESLGGGARVSLPAQTAYGSACVCCGLALLFRMAAPFIVTMGDIDSDDDSVLTADSAATAVCENQLAAAEPQVVEDEQSETPTMSSVEARVRKNT